MLRTIALSLALAFAFGSATTTLTACKTRRHKKHKKHKKYKKHKEHKEKKVKAPEISAEDAKKSAEGIGKYVFKAAFKGDADKLKSISLKEDDAKAFAKPELFQKYASAEKMKTRFGEWTAKFANARFKKIKAESSDLLTIKPDAPPSDKWKKLASQLSKEITVQQAKVFGKRADDKSKCTYVAIKLGDNNWRLLRLKGCK